MGIPLIRNMPNDIEVPEHFIMDIFLIAMLDGPDKPHPHGTCIRAFPYVRDSTNAIVTDYETVWKLYERAKKYAAERSLKTNNSLQNLQEGANES